VKKFLLLIPLLGSMLAATAAIPDLAQLQKMIARFQPTQMRVDVSKLSPGDRQALGKLIAAARVFNDIFLTQMWSGNHALYAKLRRDTTPLGKARLDYFWLNKSPWSEIDDHAAFLPDVPPKKLPGANFYPEDMTRQEFEAWVKTLSKSGRDEAEGFFTVIHRDANGKLHAVPYSQEYRAELEKSAKLLEEAAALTDNATLKKFLTERAAAFRSNNYYDSDIAWMDLDSPVDITIGPYETYNDDIFGYKAAFEAYVNVRDDAETAKLRFFADHLQEVENNLPIDPKYRNPKLGASSPIRVVNEVFDAGDAAHGVQTAAYNLPNDERVVTLKGSKRVMLKNVQEAKFHSTLEPIAKRVLSPASQKDLSFDAFFTHILAHELSHGIGPHQITVGGRATSPRQELKELYSAIEEAKADITGLFMLQHLYDKKLIEGGPNKERQLYTTFLASTFRTLRFGLNDAHGKGMAMQVNYITDKGGFIARSDGTFEVNFDKIRGAVRDLDHDLLTIEATGDYGRTKQMLDQLGVIRPDMQKALKGLDGIPVDIQPAFVTANELAPVR
jgi:Peptidase family M49